MARSKPCRTCEDRTMPEVTQQQVVEYIKGISVLELSQLVKTLESELGVSAAAAMPMAMPGGGAGDRKSTRLNSSHSQISYAVFCLKKKKKNAQDKAARTIIY